MNMEKVRELVSQHSTQTYISRGVEVSGDGTVTCRFSAFDGYAEEPDYLLLTIRDGEYTLIEWPFDGPKVLATGRALGMVIEPAQIQERLATITAAARERMSQCSADLVGAIGGAEINFMTPEERMERHQLMLMMPTFAEEREAARERIAQRILLRRQHRKAA
ncbi:hypothetical protein [Aromatoleum evansii]|uniref:hypothetical protein n=1 Tax=Aromatoleum evansii TaxID=59406 RepID=UPI001FE7CD0E|nr:hypothetical protein [Aromatoleum evansii]